ncbi:MAG: arsenate reductase family protein [Sulfurovum sp.]|nr:arsenate reductase family protein [Sulfurovum sp.]
MLKVYGIKNCASVKKAIKHFETYGVPYIFIDLRESPATQKKIDDWLKYVDIHVLFNTKSTTYRTLKLKDLALNEKEKAQWLTKDNMLIKRPVVEWNDDITVGYNESVYQKKLH